jgi:zinc and cadmium transporter
MSVMVINTFFAFLSVLAVSLASLVGAFFLSLNEDKLKKYVHFFISLAIGALLGDAFIHLIPESFEKIPNPSIASIFIITGIIIFFIIEKFLHWHHHGEDKEENHIHPVGKLILFSDGFHNLIDGIIIGVSFMASIPLGIATTIAVLLHEIPQEIGDFAVLIHSGYTKKRALFLNFLSALTAIFGLFIALIFGNLAESFSVWILPIAAGGFIYIAVADLIPELRVTKKMSSTLSQIFFILLGVFLMVSLTLLE